MTGKLPIFSVWSLKEKHSLCAGILCKQTAYMSVCVCEVSVVITGTASHIIIIIVIVTVTINMALQLFVGCWQLSQFPNPILSR
jgi:hypothetical protein